MTGRPPFRGSTRFDRDVELGFADLSIHDWPGGRGPVVCLPDPWRPGASFDELGEALAPEWRVIAAELPTQGSGHGYQVRVAETMALLDQFGFQSIVLVGESYGALISLLVAAWYPERIQALVLMDGGAELTERQLAALGGGEARAYRDGPPNVTSLHASVRCPKLVVRTAFNATTVERAGIVRRGTGTLPPDFWDNMPKDPEGITLTAELAERQDGWPLKVSPSS